MTRRKLTRRTDVGALPAKDLAVLLADVRELIVQSREGVARAVDAGLSTLYWHMGQRIRQDILKEKRAGYGEQIVSALSAQLEQEFGRGCGEKNLRRMIQFAEAYPDREIVVSLLRQLGWTHFLRLIPIDDPRRAASTLPATGRTCCRRRNWNASS